VAVRSILKEFPSAYVMFDADVRYERTCIYISDYRGKLVYENIMYGPKLDLVSDDESDYDIEADWDDRMFIRSWGTQVMDLVCLSNHPFHETAIEDEGWVEIFLRIKSGDEMLELPPRP